MNRSLIILALGAVMSLSASGADTSTAGDLARLQGRWVAKAGAERKVDVSLDVNGSRVKIKIVTPSGVSFNVRGELKLDDKASPKMVDWTRFRGSDGVPFPEILGIYEFEGDVLRVCNSAPNDSRPTRFAAGDSPLADVVTFERPRVATTVGKNP